jgi:hypothetical protein
MADMVKDRVMGWRSAMSNRWFRPEKAVDGEQGADRLRVVIVQTRPKALIVDGSLSAMTARRDRGHRHRLESTRRLNLVIRNRRFWLSERRRPSM